MTDLRPPSVPPGIPPVEHEVDESLVACLLRTRCPDLAGLPLKRTASGWDNQLFRLGDDLAVRLPRRQLGVDLIRKEQRWLPLLAPRLELPISAPLHTFEAAADFPWPWSVVPWMHGATAEQQAPGAAEAGRYGRFLRALHHPPPPDAPRSPVRGVPLSRREASVAARLERLAGRDTGVASSPRQMRDAWLDAAAAPGDLPDTWIHGDLTPMNVIVRDGRLAGIIDWGDLCVGDAATDLASAWFLFEEAEAVFAAYGPLSAATRRRARGWAILFGVLFLDTGLHADPRYAKLGQQLLNRVLAVSAG